MDISFLHCTIENVCSYMHSEYAKGQVPRRLHWQKKLKERKSWLFKARYNLCAPKSARNAQSTGVAAVDFSSF
eukprot:1157143-Pelagomonas_calceolata.AAC.3